MITSYISLMLFALVAIVGSALWACSLLMAAIGDGSGLKRFSLFLLFFFVPPAGIGFMLIKLAQESCGYNYLDTKDACVAMIRDLKNFLKKNSFKKTKPAY